MIEVAQHRAAVAKAVAAERARCVAIVSAATDANHPELAASFLADKSMTAEMARDCFARLATILARHPRRSLDDRMATVVIPFPGADGVGTIGDSGLNATVERARNLYNQLTKR